MASVVVAASTLADLGSGGGPIVDLSYPKAATRRIRIGDDVIAIFNISRTSHPRAWVFPSPALSAARRQAWHFIARTGMV